jgi:hypothetical protein
MARPSQAPRPARKTDRQNPQLCLAAADALMNAFSWGSHPWGTDFWRSVHAELAHMGSDARIADNT